LIMLPIYGVKAHPDLGCGHFSSLRMSTISSQQNGQQGASSPVPLSCPPAHQQALPHWSCALTQVHPALESCMSAFKSAAKAKGLKKA